jgi:hypothetical protein
MCLQFVSARSQRAPFGARSVVRSAAGGRSRGAQGALAAVVGREACLDLGTWWCRGREGPFGALQPQAALLIGASRQLGEGGADAAALGVNAADGFEVDQGRAGR